MFSSAMQLWLIIMIMGVLIALPTLVGIAIFKCFRRYRPFPPMPNKLTSERIYEHLPHDGFCKVSLCGWLVCGPLYLTTYWWLANSI